LPHEHPAGLVHPGAAVPAHAGQRRRSAVLLQLLRSRWRAALSGPPRYAVANDATCTRASLKHAPSPMSVSVSGTSAVPLVLLRVLRRQIPFGRLTTPGRTTTETVSGQWTS